MRLADRDISPDQPPYIIAEIGVNHNGSADRAMEMVEAAQRASADAVKFQLFEADRLLSRAAVLAQYQQRSGASDPLAMLRSLELKVDELEPIVARAHDLGLHAIVSIFSVELVEPAVRLAWDALKVASPDIINRPLIEAMMSAGRPMVLSTGAATTQEIAEASIWLGTHPHLFMHCVSSYPTADACAQLAGREGLLEITSHALGYSDHTTSIDTGAFAVAGGACLLEKHFTLDPDAPGPDHAASLVPDAMAEYVRRAPSVDDAGYK